MNTILLTGAAGFIGSHVADLLLRSGWKVVGLDALTENYNPAVKLRNIASLSEKDHFTFVHDDLVTADLHALVRGVDGVIHLAAEPGVSKSWGEMFRSYVDRNVLATQRLLEVCAARRVARFVYASSSSVYGPTNRPMRESDRLAPLSPYGVSKLAGECLVGSYAHEQGLSTVSLRFFSVYGPRQRPDMAIHRFVEALLDGRQVDLYGTRVQLRDFTYVGDVARAVVAALQADAVPGTVLNIANGRPVPIPELLRMTQRAVGAELSVVRQPHRPGDTDCTHGDSTAAAEVLGWRSATDLSTGLARQVAWHRSLRAAAVPSGRAELTGTTT